MNHPIFELNGITHVAGGQKILDNVSWRVRTGEHWAMLGPNGAGKTSILRVAGGYLWPNAGGIICRLGQELLDLRQLRRSIGWVSNTLNAMVPKDEKALDTVVSGRTAQLGLKIFRGTEPEPADYAIARTFLEQLGQANVVEKEFGVLSQGEQQAVLVARARMALPLLMILDEPCAGMDPGTRERFLDGLNQLLADPDAPSIVIVTHHVEEILPGFVNTLVVNNGCIVNSGPTRDVINRRSLSDLYKTPLRELVESDGRFWPVF